MMLAIVLALVAHAVGLQCSPPQGGAIPLSTEFLPAQLRDPCTEAFADQMLESALALGRTNVTLPEGATTVGKRVHFAAAAMYAARREGPRWVPPQESKAQDRYARGSTCRREQAWSCLFGEPAPRSQQAISQDASQGLLVGEGGQAVVAMGVMSRVVAPHPFGSRHVQVRNRIPQGAPYVLVHVRRSDACEFWLEERSPYQLIFWDVYHRRPCYTWPVYLREVQRMRSLYGFSNVVLISEDEGAVADAVASLEAEFTVSYLEYDRQVMGEPHNGQWGENIPNPGADLPDSALGALRLAAGASAYVGHMYSHFGKAMYQHMAGHAGVAPPYIAVDGGSLHNAHHTSDSLSKSLEDYLV